MGGCAGKFKTDDGLKSPALKSAEGAKEAILNSENSKTLAEVEILEHTKTNKICEDEDAKETFAEGVKDGAVPNQNGEDKEDAKQQETEGKKIDNVKKEEAVSA